MGWDGAEVTGGGFAGSVFRTRFAKGFSGLFIFVWMDFWAVSGEGGWEGTIYRGMKAFYLLLFCEGGWLCVQEGLLDDGIVFWGW